MKKSTLESLHNHNRAAFIVKSFLLEVIKYFVEAVTWK